MKKDTAQVIFRTVVVAGAMLGAGACGGKKTSTTTVSNTTTTVKPAEGDPASMQQGSAMTPPNSEDPCAARIRAAAIARAAGTTTAVATRVAASSCPDRARLMTTLDVLAAVDAQGRDEDYEPTSPWWLSGTPLESEHHRLMRRRPVPIPWAASTADSLAPAERARLAATWMRRSEAEYLAVSTFSVLAIDLVAAMAPADVITLCLRSGIDEVRHAEMCLRMASIYNPALAGGHPMPVPKMSTLPDDKTRPKLHQALANTMLVSCVSETYATTVLSATRDLTTDPTALAVLTSIYSDEVAHARLGWSYLRYAIDTGGDGVIEAAAEMLPRALRGVANVVERARPTGEVTAAVRTHGLMTPPRSA